MHCRKVLELLPKFIENDFSEEESREISAHLESCDRCRLECESMRGLVERLEAFPIMGVPSSFKEAVMRHLPPKDPGGKSGG